MCTLVNLFMDIFTNILFLYGLAICSQADFYGHWNWTLWKTPLYCFHVYRKPVFLAFSIFFEDIFHVQHLFVQLYLLRNCQQMADITKTVPVF